MSIADNLSELKEKYGSDVALVAVSKYSTVDQVREAYDAGQRIFGENKVQDVLVKAEALPEDIEWHFIGHLQRNKVKQIAPFVSLIQACDSLRLLQEINKQAAKNERTISCLLQMKIAQEESKFGMSANEILNLLKSDDFRALNNIKVIGLMAMASNVREEAVVGAEFGKAKQLFNDIAQSDFGAQVQMEILSMGMSQDASIAIANGSNMVRVGSAIFK